MTRDIMIVETEIYEPSDTQNSTWLMNFLSPIDDDPNRYSTGLWRTKKMCQFKPSSSAVKELLEYLGFTKVTQLEPVAEGLEERYYDGTRATFIARRV